MSDERRRLDERVNASKNNEHPLDVPDDEVPLGDGYSWCSDCQEEVYTDGSDECPECGGTDIEPIDVA